MNENKKIKVIKEKKIKRIKKKVLINYFYSQLESIEESYRELLKYVEEPIGDIKANLLLEKKSDILWHMEIRPIDDPDNHYVSLTSGLWMVIKMLIYFRRVYDIKELRPDNYKEEEKEKKNGGS